MNLKLLVALLALVLAWPALPAWADAAAISVTGDANIQATISSDNQAVAAEGVSYALSGFKRAQAGSNRDVDGSYKGYGYFLGTGRYDVSLIATDDFAVLYIDPDAAQRFGIDPGAAASASELATLVRAIDNANASGGAQLDESLPVYVTADATFACQGLTFRFNVQGDKGCYDFVTTEDGADPTDGANSQAVRFTHGAFAQVVDAHEANILAEPSLLDQLTTFLSHIDYSPLWVTLKTTLTSIVFIFILGLAAAYFTLRISPRARDIFDAIFTIPMVLPPTVCGFLLLLALGNNTALGRWFIDIGFRFSPHLQLAGHGDRGRGGGLSAYVPQRPRRLRGPRPQHARCGPHAGLVERADLLQAHAAPGLDQHRFGHRARLCPRAGRIRGHPLSGRQLPGHHPHDSHRDLLRMDERQHRHRDLLDDRHPDLQLHRDPVHQPVGQAHHALQARSG